MGQPGANDMANAAALGNLGKVRELLDQGADPNAVNSYDRTPIQVQGPARGVHGEPGRRLKTRWEVGSTKGANQKDFRC